MDFSAYTDLLWNTAHFKLKFLVIAAVVCLIPCIKCFVRFCSKKEVSTDLIYTSIGCLFLIALFLVRSDVDLLIKDISGECYLSAHGEYTIEVTRADRTTPRTEWIVFISDDGEKIVLQYPKDGEALIDIPEEGGSGTIWYSENSNRILDYIPDETIEDS